MMFKTKKIFLMYEVKNLENFQKIFSMAKNLLNNIF